MRMRHYRVRTKYPALSGVDTLYAWCAPGAKALNLRFLWGPTPLVPEEHWSEEIMVEPIPEHFRDNIGGFLRNLHYTAPDTFEVLA